MIQYNRIMLGEHGKYLSDCLENNYIGTNFLSDMDLSAFSHDDESEWRKKMVEIFLQKMRRSLLAQPVIPLAFSGLFVMV